MRWYYVRMRQIVLTALAALSLSGCTGLKAHQKAYVAAAVSKQIVTESHELYSGQLNARADECDPDSNPEIKTEAQYDTCLGPFAKNNDIVLALEIYTHAAEVLFSYLKKGGDDKDQLRELRTRVLDAALALLNHFPESEAAARQLEGIVGRK